jgi:diguanylate cyclase
MSNFFKQNNPDKWKTKYYELFDKNEILEKTYQNKEELLCKTIIRLSLATTGFNKQLDPYLLRIRNQLKKGLKSEQLNTELETFSNALMTLEESDPDKQKPDISVLFEFLNTHFAEQKCNFQQLQVKYEKDDYPNIQYLFVAINDLIDSIQQIEPIVVPSSKDSNDLDSENIDSKSVNTQLQHLLEETEIPTKFYSQTQELKDKLYGNAPLAIVLDETISLLFNIKTYFQSEQRDLADFLSQFTDQLTELGKQALGTQSSSESSEKKRTLLDQSVSSQVLDLHHSSKTATKLEPLKQLLNTRLIDISQQIKQHQTEELIERSKVHQKLEFLTNKIHEMELESRQLNNKLKASQQQAIHDPLTGLPNRLAYDQRLTIEIARWKRYQSPLSLLIWDIDLFKKINDDFGHKAGDKTLILIAKLLSNYCRETDFVSRFGGEEFTMLLSDTDAYSALHTANKLRKVIEQTAFNSNGKKISITISCGITQFIENDTGTSAFNRADNALYTAKDNGRNQCVIG